MNTQIVLESTPVGDPEEMKFVKWIRAGLNERFGEKSKPLLNQVQKVMLRN